MGFTSTTMHFTDRRKLLVLGTTSMTLLVVGCGSGKKGLRVDTAPKRPASAIASAPSREGSSGVSDASAGLGPSLTPWVAPTLTRSKVAKLVLATEGSPCPVTSLRETPPVEEEVHRLRSACNGVAMGANAKVLPLVQGSQDGTAPPNSLELLGRANVCYRFFLAAPSSRVGVALTLRDSVGDIALDAVAPGPNLVAPPRGYLCFERDDRAAMVVSLGQGGPHAFALLVEESPRTPR